MQFPVEAVGGHRSVATDVIYSQTCSSIHACVEVDIHIRVEDANEPKKIWTDWAALGSGQVDSPQPWLICRRWIAQDPDWWDEERGTPVPRSPVPWSRQRNRCRTNMHALDEVE